MAVQNISKEQAYKYVGERVGADYTPPVKESVDQNLDVGVGAEILKAAGLFYNKCLMSHPDSQVKGYLNSRGLNDQSIKENLIGYSDKANGTLGKHLLDLDFKTDNILATGLCYLDSKNKGIGKPKLKDAFVDGYTIPYFNSPNSISYFNMRHRGGGYKKLSTKKGSPAVDHCVLGLYQLSSNNTNKPILILEGIFDYLLAKQEFSDTHIVISGAAAQLSKKHASDLSALLVQQALRTNKGATVIICNDADPPGRQGALILSLIHI